MSPKKGKGKLPLFCDHGERVIPIYGVGVAAQRIVMKYFITFFGYRFAVPEVPINNLDVH